MFISKYEKDELHKKIDALSLLVAQATERAQKSEEKAIELSLKISSMEQLQIQQQLKLVEALEEVEETLLALKELYEKKYITEEVYLTRTDALIKSLDNKHGA